MIGIDGHFDKRHFKDIFIHLLDILWRKSPCRELIKSVQFKYKSTWDNSRDKLTHSGIQMSFPFHFIRKIVTSERREGRSFTASDNNVEWISTRINSDIIYSIWYTAIVSKFQHFKLILKVHIHSHHSFAGVSSIGIYFEPTAQNFCNIKLWKNIQFTSKKRLKLS